ncbi:MAG: type I-E CRISPR-associated protein Cas7/Cse4/CasC, partial [Spirochaetales bacterium]|nr:type I-E CRISPR-associated protein Cas7/Cse4/CasC [Spirochaetales bacterium]
TVAPSGKQNSYASRARALYIMAEKGSQQPRQLSSAFLKPVDDADMANAAISRIEILRENMDKVYGACADGYKVLNVDKGEGSLGEILDFVGA